MVVASCPCCTQRPCIPPNQHNTPRLWYALTSVAPATIIGQVTDSHHPHNPIIDKDPALAFLRSRFGKPLTEAGIKVSDPATPPQQETYSL